MNSESVTPGFLGFTRPTGITAGYLYIIKVEEVVMVRSKNKVAPHSLTLVSNDLAVFPVLVEDN